MSPLHEEKITAANAGVAGGAMAVYSISLNDWVLIVTIIYFLLQIGLLLGKYYENYKSRKAKKESKKCLSSGKKPSSGRP